MDFSLKTDYSLLYFPVSIILALVISYYYYKKSVLEGLNKKLFTALRFLSLFFLFMLLSSPVISFFKNTFQEPVNVYLIDNSQSLLIDNRVTELRKHLDGKIRNSFPDNSENLFFLYSGNLYKEINLENDNFPYEGINNFETNLNGSFYSLQERLVNKNISSVTVISDGIINEGGNPLSAAKLLNVPVNYILIGDTLQHNDLVLKNLYFNKTAFIESSVPVNIEINSYNYGTDIKINLYEEDNLIQSSSLRVSPDNNSYSLSFNVTSNTEKVVKYKIEIEGLNDEITLKNNYREFFVKFINNKFKVLVLAGGPGADFAFISEEIKKVKNFETTFLTQKSGTEFYEGALPDLKNFDSFILIGYPTSVSNPNILSEIRDNLEINNSSLIFFASRNTDYSRLSLLEEKLPFRISNFSQNEEETGIKAVSNLNNDVFKKTDLIAAVNSFPNIFKTSSLFSVNPSAETVLLMNKNSEPAFIMQNTERNKSAAFLAYGIYKWRLNSRKNNAEEVLNYILTSAIIAITNKDEKKSFTVETTKPVYSKFENVKFTARVTNFELQGGEQIKVNIAGPGYTGSFDLAKKENRYFEGEINVPSEGTYIYTAELISKNNIAESIENKFAIGENNFEYRLTRSDNSVLSNLANETSGFDFSHQDLSEIKSIFKNLNEKSKSEIRSKKNYELNFNPYYLGIIIFLLCLEWFLRKRNNLP